MDKKTMLIGAISAVGVVALLFVWRAVSLKEGDDGTELAGGVYSEARSIMGDKYLVPPGDIFDLGLTSGELPPLTNPEFTSVANADTVLADELYGIALEVEGVARFYPVQVLNWHYVVNDVVNGKRLAVTYDTLTGSAAVFEAEDLTFKVAGKVYNNNALLEDNKGNLWYQIRGQAIVGENAGATLTAYPFQMVRWSDWKNEHPDGEALDFSTGYTREYRRHPHGGYETTSLIYFPLNYVATPMPIKWTVDTVVMNGEAAAFAREEMAEDLVMSETVGGTPVVAFYDTDRQVTNVFNAAVADKTLTFIWDKDEEVFVDHETGTSWNADGKAIDGELEGAQLTSITAPEAYWYAWAAAYPATKYPGIEAEDAPKAE